MQVGYILFRLITWVVTSSKEVYVVYAYFSAETSYVMCDRRFYGG